MPKEIEKLVKSTAALHQEMSNLSTDEINAIAPMSDPEPQKESLEQIAKREGVLYIKPKRQLSPAVGSLDKCKNPEKIKKEHARDWEYVKGMYENYVISGEPLKFSLCLYPGDPDLLWEIPCNVPIYVPRMVAKHLEEIQKYHTFSYIEMSPNQWQSNDFTHQFSVSGTTYRGKFRALEAFA